MRIRSLPIVSATITLHRKTKYDSKAEQDEVVGRCIHHIFVPPYALKSGIMLCLVLVRNILVSSMHFHH